MKTNPHDPVNPSEKMSGMNIGITLREYFAAMAMQGMLHNGATTMHGVITQAPESIAILAVNQSDALIEALNK